MKLIKIIGHPILVLSIFLLLLISGESFGGFYLLYICLGLPHGVPHAIIAVAAVASMVVGFNIQKKQPGLIKPLLYLFGIGLMLLALITFFSDSKGYNDGTFRQTAPLISFGIFGLCVLCNVILSVWLFVQSPGKNDHHLNVAS